MDPALHLGCGIRANKGWAWKEVGSLWCWVFFFCGQWDGTAEWWWDGRKEDRDGREGREEGNERGIRGRRQYVFVCQCLFPSMLPSQLCSAPGLGWGGQAWAKLSSSSVLPPGTVSLCWTWTGCKVHGASRHCQAGPGLAAGQVHHLSVPPQVLQVHAGLRLLEGPLCPRGHRRSQLAQSWWQGRSAMCHRHGRGRVDAGSVPGWWLVQMAGVVSSTAPVPVAVS